MIYTHNLPDGKALARFHLDFRRVSRPCGILRVTVAHQTEAGTAIQERAKRSLSGAGPTVTFSSEGGDPATSIITHCAHDTLAVMGAYNHSRLYYMVLGSVTEQVIRFAQGPVLLSAKQGAAAAKCSPLCYAEVER